MEEESGDGSSEVLKPELVVKSWTENMNISKLCRICANTSDNLISIFEGEGVEHELLLKINKHLPLKVSQEDRLPKNVCYPCTSTLIAWHDMTVSCIEADKRLHSLIQDTSETAVSDDEFCDDSQSMDLGDHDIDIVEDKAVVPTGLPGGTEELKIVEVSTVKKTATSPTKSNVKKDNNVSELPVVTEEEEVVSTVPESSVDVANVEACVASTSSATSTTNNEVTTEDNAVMETIEETQWPKNNCTKQEDIPKFLSKYLNNDNDKSILIIIHDIDEKLATDYFLKSDTFEKKNGVRSNDKNLCNLQNSKINKADGKVIGKVYKRFVCQLCNKVFVSLSLMKKHLLNHDEVPELRKIENKIITKNALFSKVEIENDTEMKGSKILYECELCREGFCSLNDFKNHVSDHECEEERCENNINQQNLKWQRDVCREIKYFGRRDSLECDLSLEDEKRIHIIKKCETSGDNKKIENENFMKDENIYECQLCDTMFCSSSLLKEHLLFHDVAIQKEWENKKNGSLNLVAADVDVRNASSCSGNISSAVKRFQCDVCKSRFMYKWTLKTHMLRHIEKYPYLCHICGRTFNNKSSICFHVKHVHNGVKEHVCNVCGRKFAIRGSLEVHLRMHTGERPFMCDACGKTFPSSTALKIHHKSHENNNNKKCRNKPTKRYFPLLDETKKTHACDICGRNFRYPRDVRRHRSIHSTERPYVCQYCPSSFNVEQNFKRHVDRHLAKNSKLANNSINS